MYTNRYGGTTGVGVIDGKATPDTYVLSDGEMQLSFFNDFSVVYRVNVKRHATLKDLEVEGLMDQTFNRDQKITMPMWRMGQRVSESLLPLI